MAVAVGTVIYLTVVFLHPVNEWHSALVHISNIVSLSSGMGHVTATTTSRITFKHLFAKQSGRGAQQDLPIGPVAEQ